MAYFFVDIGRNLSQVFIIISFIYWFFLEAVCDTQILDLRLNYFSQFWPTFFCIILISFVITENTLFIFITIWCSKQLWFHKSLFIIFITGTFKTCLHICVKHVVRHKVGSFPLWGFGQGLFWWRQLRRRLLIWRIRSNCKAWEYPTDKRSTILLFSDWLKLKIPRVNYWIFCQVWIHYCFKINK